MFGILTIGEVDLAVVFIFFASIIILPLQIFLCFKVKKLVLRLIPAILSALTSIIFFAMYFIATGWDTLGWLLITIYSILNIAMCGVGWIVWLCIKWAKKKQDTTMRSL